MNYRAKSGLFTRVVIALGVAIALSLTSPTAGGSVPSLRKHYGDSALSFRYPAMWQISHFTDDVSTFSTLDVVVSNQQLHDPCASYTAPGGHPGWSCQLPLNRLTNNGVFVEWTVYSQPGYNGNNLNRSSGRTGRLGGLPYRVDVTRPGICRGIVDGQETISVTAAQPNSESEARQHNAVEVSFTMLACMRGPRLQSLSNDVLAMLNSTTFRTN